MWQLLNLDLIDFQNNLTYLIWFQHSWNQCRWAEISKSTHSHRYAKNYPITWLLFWQLPIDTNFIHFIFQFQQFFGVNARECFHAAAPQQDILGDLIVWWLSPFRLQWTMAEGIVLGSSPANHQPNPQRNKKWNMYPIKQIKICAKYRDMLPRP